MSIIHKIRAWRALRAAQNSNAGGAASNRLRSQVTKDRNALVTTALMREIEQLIITSTKRKARGGHITVRNGFRGGEQITEIDINLTPNIR